MHRFFSRALRIMVLAGILGPHLIIPVSFAQGKSGGGDKGGNNTGGGNGPNSPGNNQGPQQPSANNQGPSAPGITGGSGGSIAIESVLFAYKALGEDAHKIARAVVTQIPDGHVVVIATPADFAGLLQWRTTMYQADLLDDRLTAATNDLIGCADKPPASFSRVQKSIPTVGAGPFIAGPSDVQALVQTLASMFAVNESVSAASGALGTTPLTNLLADELRSDTRQVFVPSVYAANLAGNDDLDGTLIGAKLEQLEKDLKKARDVGQKCSLALADANTVSTSAESGAPIITSISPLSGPQGTPVTLTGLNFGDQQPTSTVTVNGTPLASDKVKWSPTTIQLAIPTGAPAIPMKTGLQITVNVAGQSSNPKIFTVAQNVGPQVPSPVVTPPETFTHDEKIEASKFMADATSKLSALSSVVTAAQSFESTLLTGQTVPTGTQQNPQQQQTTGNTNTGAGVGAPPLTMVGGSSPSGQTTGNNNNNATAPAISAITSPSPLQQILPADLLAGQVWGKEHPTKDDMAKVHILVIQTLESGGNQLSKSNLFLGSRTYFNGGAVATFGLYGADGTVQCGGFAYAYGGYTKDDDFAEAFSTDPEGEIESSCRVDSQVKAKKRREQKRQESQD